MMMFERRLIGEFKGWLEAQGKTLLEPQGDYEVLRWQGESCRPMPIIHRRARTRDFSVNREAEKMVKKFLKTRKN